LAQPGYNNPYTVNQHMAENTGFAGKQVHHAREKLVQDAMVPLDARQQILPASHMALTPTMTYDK